MDTRSDASLTWTLIGCPKKNRPFAMKGSQPVLAYGARDQGEQQEPPKPPPDAKPDPPKPPAKNKTNDAQGLKTAYAAESGFYRDPDKTHGRHTRKFHR